MKHITPREAPAKTPAAADDTNPQTMRKQLQASLTDYRFTDHTDDSAIYTALSQFTQAIGKDRKNVADSLLCDLTEIAAESGEPAKTWNGVTIIINWLYNRK